MIDIGIHNQIGKLIIEMKDIIKELSCLEMADIDVDSLEEEYQKDINTVQNLIIKSRNIIDDSYFEFVIGEN